jgi:hypothetical protein
VNAAVYFTDVGACIGWQLARWRTVQKQDVSRLVYLLGRLNKF